MANREKCFKIFMILLCCLLFVGQIYYMCSIFMTYLDMKDAFIVNDLKYIYEAHPNLIISRIIVAFMETQKLNINFLSGVMVVFLFLGALDFVDLIYFGLILISIYYSSQVKNNTLKVFSLVSIFRIVLFIAFIVSGGICVLSVFTIGNISVSQAVELGIYVIPFYLIFLSIISILMLIVLVKLEFRKS